MDGSNPACVVDVDECDAARPPCSVQPPVQCINLPGSFFCSNCPPGNYRMTRVLSLCDCGIKRCREVYK